jgi:CheY-like chemotaxis protein
MRILLVDDEPLILKSYGRQLHRRGGHDIVTASGGAEALATLEADPDFDFIFCDLSMPGVDGIEVHHAIREYHPELANRFAFMTGGQTAEAAHDYLRGTDARVLAKPIREAEFEKALTEVNGSRGSR